jgi:NAD(P)-dependent dehydrogenase (short-subunit alcohol dehydrogenase family)
MNARNAVAIVTGASSQIGLATATLLAQAGWRLLLCGQNERKLSAAAQSLGHANVRTLAHDIAALDFSSQLAAVLSDEDVGACVHCSGIGGGGVTPERVLDVNLGASMRLLDWLLPRMAPGGAVVLISSTAGYLLDAAAADILHRALLGNDIAPLLQHYATPPEAYRVSKRGLHVLARMRAGAFGARGARLVSLSPGVIDAGMGRAFYDATPMVRQMIENAPQQRMGLASEVAAVAAFLCSPAASFLTGIDVVADGGQSALSRP